MKLLLAGKDAQGGVARARIGFTAVLHTWDSAMTHHPHVHCVVPGGGVSLDGERWAFCRKGFFLPARVLSRLFRRLFLEQLDAAHRDGQLQFFGEQRALSERGAFSAFLKPLRTIDWVVYAKPPFAGPAAVLEYLSRYTHRVAIANSRLVALDERGVTFKWKDYRKPTRERYKTMTLAPDEFIRRFLLHVQPHGFHRIHHYGLLANHQRTHALKKARELLRCEPPLVTNEVKHAETHEHAPTFICPACGAAMIIIETFERGHAPRASPSAAGPPCRT